MKVHTLDRRAGSREAEKVCGAADRVRSACTYQTVLASALEKAKLLAAKCLVASSTTTIEKLRDALHAQQ